MATSPIYSWPEPDNTDLVKNGALAIRTLGNAIDTTMATMTPKTIVDAKGDLIAASAADTPARLAVGNNGETLVADSSTSTGLRYNPQNALANPIINGGMDIWQRGTSIAGAASITNYVTDRFVGYRTGTTFSRQATNDTTNLPNIQYSVRSQRDSGNTATGQIYLSQSVESVMARPFAGKTVTFSYYARAGANYSGASNNLELQLTTGTGTDENVLGTYTGGVSAITQNATLTTTWQRFVGTATFPTNTNQFGFYWRYTPVGTAGANDWFEITGVQLDIGTYTASTAPTFRRSGGTIQGELAAAMRYFQKTYSQATAPATAVNAGSIVGINVGTTLVGGLGRFAVVMRTSPTITLYSVATGTSGKIRSGGADIDGTASDVGDGVIGYIAATGLTAGSNSIIQYTASAEL